MAAPSVPAFAVASGKVSAPVPRLRPAAATVPAPASLAKAQPVAVTTPAAPQALAPAAPLFPVPVAVTDAVGQKLSQWQAALNRKDLSAAAFAATLKAAPDWPAQSLIRVRYEQALVREAPKADAVIAAFANTEPSTADAALLLAHALVDAGRKDDAAAVVRKFWRKADLGEGTEKTFLADFGGVLTAADHQARVDRLLYDDSATAALRTAKLLDPAERALAEARAAVINGSGSQGKLLDAVPQSLRTDPGYILAKAQYLRRTKNYADAANLLLSAPTDPGLIGDADAWSEERRELARRFIDVGDAPTAYALVNGARAASQTPRVEAEFDAGWYGLDYLKDPGLARPHFQAILDRSATPISQARGAYWLGRTAEAEGDIAGAVAKYQQAAQFPTAFYGQIAAARLKATSLPILPPPAADSATATRFGSRELVQALFALRAKGDDGTAGLFYGKVATTLADPAEFVLLAGLANDEQRYSLVVTVGKAAQAKGIAVGTLGFPDNALPKYPGPVKIDLSVLYAIARQESEFDPGEVSAPGAVGMFQVMPQYAKEMADKAGIPYVKAKVKSDPVYNMQLGAAELADDIATYDGSYLLAFAAYNAGQGRVAEWIRLNGDPRDANVDVLDWIERIPFDETRNYVQRVLENLQVYRAMQGDGTLRIEADMRGQKWAAAAARNVAADAPKTAAPPAAGSAG